MDKLSLAGNAETEGRSAAPIEQVDRNATEGQRGLVQDSPANENTQATPQTSRAPLSISVIDESGYDELAVKMRPDTHMRKLMMNVCANLGTPLDVSCFSHGRYINPDDIPASVCSSC